MDSLRNSLVRVSHSDGSPGQARTVKNTLVTHIYVRKEYVREGFSSVFRTAQNVVSHIICLMFFFWGMVVVTKICMYLYV